MYLKEYVSWMVHTYPLIFKSDTIEETYLKALDHLFFTPHNGMEWYDGYLIEVLTQGVMIKKKLTDHSFRLVVKAPKYGSVRYREPLDEDFMKTDKVEEVPNGKINVMIPQRNKQPWFPAQLGDTSRIFNIPKDVKDDWLAGASFYLGFAIGFYSDSMRVAKDDETFLKYMEKFHTDSLSKRERIAKIYIEEIEGKLRLAVANIIKPMKKRRIIQGQELEVIDRVVPQ